MNIDSELDEILKEAQETIPEGDYISYTGTPKQAVQETLLPLLRQLLYSKKLWQSMLLVLVDKQTLQSFHLSQLPIQDLLMMNN